MVFRIVVRITDVLKRNLTKRRSPHVLCAPAVALDPGAGLRAGVGPWSCTAAAVHSSGQPHLNSVRKVHGGMERDMETDRGREREIQI